MAPSFLPYPAVDKNLAALLEDAQVEDHHFLKG
jgi:hypothetical protein